MADVVQFIRDEIAPEFEKVTDPILGHSTVSVGTISGGSKTNIVPDSCEATVDIRTVPSQNSPEFLESLKARLQAIAPGLEVSAGQATPLQTDGNHPVIAKLESLGAKCVGAPWFCDAAVFARHGVPSIALGPGSISQAHTEDEWIDIAEFERGVRFFRDFLAAL
jgi:acetylornithine deacetylase/succinyl-diaminopimelate desuccinylase-like protein